MLRGGSLGTTEIAERSSAVLECACFLQSLDIVGLPKRLEGFDFELVGTSPAHLEKLGDILERAPLYPIVESEAKHERLSLLGRELRDESPEHPPKLLALKRDIGKNLLFSRSEQSPNIAARHLEMDLVLLEGDLHLLLREKHLRQDLEDPRDLLDVEMPDEHSFLGKLVRQLEHVDEPLDTSLLSSRNARLMAELGDALDPFPLHELEDDVVAETHFDSNVLVSVHQIPQTR